MMAVTGVAKVRVYTPTNDEYIISVTPTTTLQQIVLEIQNVSRTAWEWNETHMFVNEGKTPMPDLTKNMVDYNNWCVEGGYIPSLYIHVISDQ
jgi:hypothetical protein